MDAEEYALIRDLRGAWFSERKEEQRSHAIDTEQANDQ